MSTMDNDNPMNRWYALLVLVIMCAVVYFLVFDSFVSEHAMLNDEVTELEQNRQDFEELAALIPELKKRIKTVKEKVGDNTSFLVADSYNIATAELTHILKKLVSNNTTSSAECQTISNTPSKDRNPDKFEKIILKVRMRCEYDKMVNILQQAEKNVPFIFIDNLNLEQRIIRRSRRNVKATEPLLEIRFDVFAYMNKPVRAKKNG